VVPEFIPVILLVKLPVPEPSVVLELAIVGKGRVLQHMPRCVIGNPPSEDTTSEKVAEFIVTNPLSITIGDPGTVGRGTFLQLTTAKPKMAAMRKLYFRNLNVIGLLILLKLQMTG